MFEKLKHFLSLWKVMFGASSQALTDRKEQSHWSQIPHKKENRFFKQINRSLLIPISILKDDSVNRRQAPIQQFLAKMKFCKFSMCVGVRNQTIIWQDLPIKWRFPQSNCYQDPPVFTQLNRASSQAVPQSKMMSTFT